MASTDDDILKLYTSLPEAKSYPAPQPLDQFEQELLKQYTAVPAAAAVAAPAKKGKGLANSDEDSTAAALAKNIATGAIKGAADVPGFVGNIKNFGTYLADRAVSAVSGQPLEDVQRRQAEIQAAADKDPSIFRRISNAIAPGNVMPSGDDISGPVLARTGAYEPQGLGENMLQGGVRAAFGGLTPGGGGANPLTGALRSAPIMAGAGAAGTFGTEVTGDPLIGAAAAMGGPAMIGGGRAAVRGSLGKLDAETATLADAAINKYGIPLGPGNLSSNMLTRSAASVAERVPFSGAPAKVAERQEAFNRAVGSTFGAPVNKLTKQVMATARDEIGQKFDTVANQTRIIPDQPLARDFATIVRDAQLGPAGAESRVRNNIGEIADRIQRNGGVIDGKTYQDLTRVGSNGKNAGVVQKLISDQDPYIRDAGYQMRNALDDALERHAPPDMVNLLREARGQWKNMRTVEDVAAKAETGDISPSLLRGRVNAKNKGTYGAAYGGGGDLAELADIGQRFLKQPPNSGTADRLTAMFGIGAGGSAATNLLLNPNYMNAATAIGAPIAGLAIGRGANAFLNNKLLASSVVDRSLGRVNPAVANKLLNLPIPQAPLPVFPEPKRKAVAK